MPTSRTPSPPHAVPPTDAGTGAPPSLRRVLSVRDLVFYGIVLIQPIAPVGIFGIASQISHGHATTTILIAMVVMMLTAWSYGRMATLHPVAGSAYTYVSRGLHPHLGFLAGWVMFLDYLIIPVINVIYIALTLERIAPVLPYAVWAGISTLAITILNLRSVRFTARANYWMLAVMFVVIIAFVAASVRYLLNAAGWGGLFSSLPLYNPATFNVGAVAAATSLAALTYIGFDGVTTLAEEVKNPRRSVPLATVLVCFVTGILSAAEIYLAQRVWPDYNTFPHLETAFLDVTATAGGGLLFSAMGAILVLACFGSGLAGQAAASRLLYGMGRDRVLPHRLFGHVDAATGNPNRNVLLVGALCFTAALLIGYQSAAELLNFGAFLAFMGVNAAALRSLDWRSGGWHPAAGAATSLAGFTFCLAIWLSLPWPAKVAGGVWLAVGITYAAVRTRGFRSRPVTVDFTESEAS